MPRLHPAELRSLWENVLSAVVCCGPLSSWFEGKNDAPPSERFAVAAFLNDVFLFLILNFFPLFQAAWVLPEFSELILPSREGVSWARVRINQGLYRGNEPPFVYLAEFKWRMAVFCLKGAT